MKSKLVVVTVPVYRMPLTEEERISVRHLRRFLGAHDIVLFAPYGLKIEDSLLAGFEVCRFDDAYFTGIIGYNKLMLSTRFYETFSDYEYLLIYQLDCLVFSDELNAWCNQGWDYIGAPWYKDHRAEPHVRTLDGLWAVGNGGFSLRRIDSFLRVLRSKRLLRSPFALAKAASAHEKTIASRLVMRIGRTIAYAMGYRNSAMWVSNFSRENEDLFWSVEAKMIDPGFSIPSPQEAIAFSFEWSPRYCYDMNKCRLPFGCHAWVRADKEFWWQFVIG